MAARMCDGHSPTDTSFRSGVRLCNGQGRWPKAGALFWCQDAYLVSSQFYKYKVCSKGVGTWSMLISYPGGRFAPFCLPVALFICYCVLASHTRPDDTRGYLVVPCSYQRLVPPSSLVFRIYDHIRPKSALLYYSYYIRAVRSDGRW